MKQILIVCLFVIIGHAGTARAEVSALINSYYVDVLNRQADAGGLIAWENYYNATGGNGAAVRWGLAKSSEGYGLVNALYRLILGRDAEAAGADNWTTQLANLGYPTVARLIAQSSEAVNLVNAAYSGCVGHAADATSLNNAVNQLPFAGISGVRSAVCNSAEAARYRATAQCNSTVSSAYSFFFGRAPSSAEQASAVPTCVSQVLAGQDAYQSLIYRLANSVDVGTLADGYYVLVLDRHPTASEMSGAPAIFKSTGLAGFIKTLTGSSEAKGKVGEAFANTLERTPTSSETSKYVGMLGQKGVGLAGVRKLLQSSSEAVGLTKSTIYEAVTLGSMIDGARTVCEKLVACPAKCPRLDADCFADCREKNSTCSP